MILYSYLQHLQVWKQNLLNIKINVPPESEELKKVTDTTETQQDTSVSGHPKNCLYIDNGAFIYVLFKQELVEGLIQLDQII